MSDNLAAEPQQVNKKSTRKSRKIEKPNSSLTLQILLFFDWYFSAFYFACTLGFLIYKAYGKSYPTAVWEMEFAALIFFCLLQFIKIDLGSKGNKTEKSSITFVSVVLALLCIICFVFYLALQTYVLVVELILNSIGLFFCIFQIIFGLVHVCIFRGVERSS